MSQKTSRKAVTDDKDKDKKTSESPVTELKKKAAASASQEKDKLPEKSTDKTEKTEKAGEKSDKKAEKNGVEKDKNGQPDKEKADKNVKQNGSKSTAKENGSKDGNAPKATSSTTNGPKGTADSKGTNGPKGTADSKGTAGPKGTNGSNGTPNGVDVVSVSDSEDDETFPELMYDESDVEPLADARSVTRRAQVHASRTPETPAPRPASDRQTDSAHTASHTDPSKDAKVLQPKDGVPANTDRKLRSADSPKPDAKKPDTPKKGDKKVEENGEKLDVEVTVEVENEEEGGRKLDTNYSKSRVKVSPYRRSGRLLDQTNSSLQANYTGNNTTMEMDITASSVSSPAEQEPSDAGDDSASYLRAIRGMRGRRSYKLLHDIQITRRPEHKAPRPANATESTTRPTAPVVGRKRKPDGNDSIDIEVAREADEVPTVAHKRMRLLDRIALPFRRGVASQPLTHRAADIVGINTDLPLTAPVGGAIDPETLKAAGPSAAAPLTAVAAVASDTATAGDRDGKRCVIV